MINLNYSRSLVPRPRAGVFLALSDPASGRVPGLALLMRLFWAAALVFTTFGAQARVVFTSLYSFTGTNDGANPRAAQVQGRDGYYYGTTFGGGTSGYGSVFKISPNGTLASTGGRGQPIAWNGFDVGFSGEPTGDHIKRTMHAMD